ncbi:MAG: sugar phosphate nucleotidyltransferase [Pseudomonadota bacterium]
MKVVFFCGGLGTRLRGHQDTTPKPMVSIGQRPILWHLMMYYAHYGHRDFILCLGYLGNQIKDYFVNYREWHSNDFELRGDSSEPVLLNKDISDWKITFVDTGLHSNIGERLSAVRPFIGDDPYFLANYSDGLSDLPLDQYVQTFLEKDKVASFACVRPSQSYHVVDLEEDGTVVSLRSASESDTWINGGFFAFSQRIFDYLGEGEELVEEPFQRLIVDSELTAYRHSGFWACIDTPKDKKAFDEMESRNYRPWQVW